MLAACTRLGSLKEVLTRDCCLWTHVHGVCCVPRRVTSNCGLGALDQRYTGREQRARQVLSRAPAGITSSHTIRQVTGLGLCTGNTSRWCYQCPCRVRDTPRERLATRPVCAMDQIAAGRDICSTGAAKWLDQARQHVARYPCAWRVCTRHSMYPEPNARGGHRARGLPACREFNAVSLLCPASPLVDR